jgi:phosphoglycerate dehydrogenase-like enzyme
LDVFAEEPLPAGSPLIGMKNVVMTPHLASFTYEGYRECADDILRSIDQFSAGKIPEHCLNPNYAAHRK